MIDTKKVAERRQLRFENFGEALADAERLAAAEAGGSLRQHGNWKLGQALGHVAAWASFPFEGYPEMRRPPWAVRKVFALLKPWFLNRTFPAGISIPHAPGGTYATEEIPTEEALARLRKAYARLESQMPAEPNPAVGPLTHDEWIKMNLRHAELHQSFFQFA